MFRKNGTIQHTEENEHMKQCDTYLGLQILSLFDTHICKGSSGKDYADDETVRCMVEDSMEFENAELLETCRNPLLLNRLRIRKHPDSTIITSAYNPFSSNDEQERANMLAVASSVSAVASLQATLIASFGTTLGGSMAFGGVHNDVVSTWGNAVDEALALKAGRSEIYPRMTVSDEIRSLFEGLCARHHVQTDGRLGNAIEYDEDGVPFINYLSS